LLLLPLLLSGGTDLVVNGLSPQKNQGSGADGIWLVAVALAWVLDLVYALASRRQVQPR
jgi:hypothetical protein